MIVFMYKWRFKKDAFFAPVEEPLVGHRHAGRHEDFILELGDCLHLHATHRMQDKTRQDNSRQGKARQGKARQGKARQDRTGQSKTGQDRTIQDRTGAHP
jgi:hypothetical protein